MKMTVNRMLLNHKVGKLILESQRLLGEMKQSSVPLSEPLAIFISRKIRQLEDMSLSMQPSGSPGQGISLADIFVIYRSIKLEMHLAKRNWKRILNNTERGRKGLLFRENFLRPAF